MAYELTLGNVANIAIFFGLGLSSYVIFYFSQKANPDKITASIFTLAFGLNMIGLSSLFRIGIETTLPLFIILSALVGALLTFAGVVLTFRQKSAQIENLKKRHEELEAVISNLKDRYYKQEISEEDLRTVHSSLLKELAELEVKMKQSKN